MKLYSYKQEYSEHFDFIGNGYGCETRKINVTLLNEKVCEIYYNEEFCLMLIGNKEFKINRHYKMLGFSEIEIINQEKDEKLGHIELPNWNMDDFKKLGLLNYQGKKYASRRLKLQKGENHTKMWDYIVELSGIETKIIYKLVRELKTFSSAKNRKQSFHGEIELINGDETTLMLGIYFVQILLNNQDVIDI